MTYTINTVKKDSDSMAKYATIVFDLLKESWGEDNKVAEQYIQLSDYLFFIKYQSRNIALTAIKFLDNNKVFITSILIHPEFQHTGIYKLIQKELLKFYIKKNLSQLRIINLFRNFWIVFRTANPQIYISLLGNNLFPSHIKKRTPSNLELKVATRVLNILGQMDKFNKDNFVINGAYENNKNLIYKLDKIPLSGNNKIDQFFINNLKYHTRKGNAFLFVGHNSILTFYRYLRNRYKQNCFWEKYFKYYDVLLKAIPYQDLMDSLIEELEIGSGDMILDAGAGTGNLSIKIKEKGGNPVCLDNSKTALKICKQKDRNISIVYHDLLRPLPFRNNYFDKIVSNNTLYTLPSSNLEEVLRELLRVLKPGGKIVIANIKKGFMPMKIYLEHMRLYLRDKNILMLAKELVKFIFPTVMMFYYNSRIKELNKDLEYHFFKEGEQYNLLKKAGFRNISREKVVYANQAILVSALK